LDWAIGAGRLPLLTRCSTEGVVLAAPSTQISGGGAKTGGVPDFEKHARHAEQVGITPSDAAGIAKRADPQGRLRAP
jgi:hypothetical protein